MKEYQFFVIMMTLMFILANVTESFNYKTGCTIVGVVWFIFSIVAFAKGMK